MTDEKDMFLYTLVSATGEHFIIQHMADLFISTQPMHKGIHLFNDVYCQALYGSAG